VVLSLLLTLKGLEMDIKQ